MATADETSHSMEITISQVCQLESVYSSDVFVHGIPWKVKVFKENDGNEADDGEYESNLAVRLICCNEDESLVCSISGIVSCKLLSFSDDVDPMKSSLIQRFSIA